MSVEPIGRRTQKGKSSIGPSPQLVRLITAYLYVPLCPTENVAAPFVQKQLAELMATRDEDDGCFEAATRAYYGPLPCRRQRRARRECASSHPHYWRGMPGLGRDVLRWLVALNLSFPIKNIKRDFSNGFMVAEIFSRYFPVDIHMHSYDYGSRSASKRDNWEQLNKVLKKKGFLVLKHEIDNIIHCRTEEGAGPLLERMYNFLTQKSISTEQLFVQQHDSSKLWDTQAPLEDSLVNGDETQDQFSSSENFNSSGHNADFEDETCDSRHRDSTSAEDMYHGALKLDPGYEHGSLLKMDDPEYDFLVCSEGAMSNQEPQRDTIWDPQSSRKKGSNAVEKARQREVRKAAGLAKAGIRGDEQRFAELAHKTRNEVGLAFRSPHRKRNFKQYTLPDYRRQKQFGYVELGRLGPGDPTPELMAQREKLARIKEFGHHARSCNIMSHANPTLVDYSKSVKLDPASARKKALAFASRIPKPKVKTPVKEESQENLLPLQNPHALTELQILEARHQSDRKHVEAIRRDLEHFLR